MSIQLCGRFKISGKPMNYTDNNIFPLYRLKFPTLWDFTGFFVVIVAVYRLKLTENNQKIIRIRYNMDSIDGHHMVNIHKVSHI